jgi:hypothetical protein
LRSRIGAGECVGVMANGSTNDSNPGATCGFDWKNSRPISSGNGWQAKCPRHSTRVPDVVRRCPAIEQIKGGVVFTHPKTIYDVPPICSSRWGVIDSWDEEIMSAPIIPGLDDRSVFCLLDALLERHHEINSDVATISMSTYATKIARQAEKRLSGWMKHE